MIQVKIELEEGRDWETRWSKEVVGREVREMGEGESEGRKRGERDVRDE